MLHPVTLRFQDQAQEGRFLSHQLDTELANNRRGILVGIVVMAAFVLVDLLLLHPPVWLTWSRLLLTVPLCFLALHLSYAAPRWFFAASALACLVTTFKFSVFLALSGAEFLGFALMAVLQCLLFTCAVITLPLPYVATYLILAAASFVAAVLVIDVAPMARIDYVVGIPVFSLLLLVLCFQRERSQRLRYLQQDRLLAVRKARTRQDLDEIEWLRGLPANLERDLQPTIFELELALDHGDPPRRLDEPQASPRAQLSLFHTLFETARHAVTLDDAQVKLDAVDLPAALEAVGVSHSYAALMPPVVLAAPGPVAVVADDQLLRQALGLILMAAAMRSLGADAVYATVACAGSQARLELVVDQAVTLSPVLTEEADEVPGLSLYVARRLLEPLRRQPRIAAAVGRHCTTPHAGAGAGGCDGHACDAGTAGGSLAPRAT